MIESMPSLSLWEGLKRRMALKYHSRPLEQYEWIHHCRTDESKLDVKLFVERRLLQVILLVRSEDQVTVEGVQYGPDDTEEAVQSQIWVQEQGGIRTYSILPLKPVDVTKISVRLGNARLAFEYQVQLIVEGSQYDDYWLIKDSEHLAASSRNLSAIKNLHEYERYTKKNPHVSYRLAVLYNLEGDLQRALDYSIRSVESGLAEQGVELYRGLCSKLPPPVPENIRALEKEAADWLTVGSAGTVVLNGEQSYRIGHSNTYLQVSKKVIHVRRVAAARMLRSLTFTFSDNRELLLYTFLYVLHKDGDVEKVSLDNFAVSDSREKNIFITVEGEREGNWILPDLVPGDVIVWEYHLLGRMERVADKSHFFCISTPFDSHEPTYHCLTEFMFPKEHSARFVAFERSVSLKYSESQEEERTVHRYEGYKYMPQKHTGFEYEENHLNPVISCSSADWTWQAVGDHIYSRNFGADNDGDTLPQPLADIVDKAAHESEALENCFYWIRDKLKYASLRSGNEQIGQGNRAQLIIESGTADCKDRAHLLALVCRQLGIPWQCVFVSAKHGMVVEELPADQFDHVFLRVKPEDQWVYLDPTNPQTPYGTPPSVYQGLQALVLDGKGSIITIPEDKPQRNLLEIHEVLDGVKDNWLEGYVDFMAHGHNSRLVNEYWKSMSLTIRDQRQAAQQVLGNYLPSCLITSFDKLADPATSSLFWVGARYKRCRLFSMGKDDSLVALIRWSVPSLPIGYWRVLQIERMFVFNFPVTVRFEVRLGQAIVDRLRSRSQISSLHNPICSVEETISREGDALTIRRQLQIMRKFVEEDHIHLVPKTMEHLESSTQLVLSLRA
ncbi:MAG: DUF3857 domain-containing protein [Candidatus Zixiibacteriota bacterium]|nr:MAG: DUF3857 domain-containing protein [candidate division Zixibacteria bacterium]